MSQVHQLKIEDCYLKAKIAGEKLFEIRVNDRFYQKGDMVVYTEYRTGGEVWKHEYEITCVTNYAQNTGFCVFGEKHIRSYPEGESK
jgi:ASC-1-like (ASCH) protein